MLVQHNRSLKRENLGIKWAGPIKSNNVVLLARKDANIKISSIEDIKKYKIGTIHDDIGEQLLISAKINKENLERSRSLKLLIDKLKRNRV